MMSIEDVQGEIIRTFQLLDGWAERYGYLIELGSRLPPIPPAFSSHTLDLAHCRTTVRLALENRNGGVQIWAAAGSPIIAGLLALLLRIYSGQPAEKILSVPLFFVRETGLDQHLTALRYYELTQIADEIQAAVRRLSCHRRAA